VRGILNVAGFYSDFSDQQIQVFFSSSSAAASPTTGIANAGASRIWGVELESSLTFFDDFRFDLSYAHLDTKLESAQAVALPPPYNASALTTAVGGR
jgi:iron complex outermembrane recepter protein